MDTGIPRRASIPNCQGKKINTFQNTIVIFGGQDAEAAKASPEAPAIAGPHNFPSSFQ